MLTQENCGIVVSYRVDFFCLIENETNCGDFAAVARGVAYSKTKM
jgi:hypothetical protein